MHASRSHRTLLATLAIAALVGTLGRVLEKGEPNEPRWPYFRALIHFDRGDLVSSEEALESAVSLDPSAVHMPLKLGEVRFKPGHFTVTTPIA